MTSERIRIGSLPWWRLTFMSVGGKNRNKKLLAKLCALNLALAGRAEIFSRLGLTEKSLDVLLDLASRSEGWQLCAIQRDLMYEVERLAALGLVFLAWPSGPRAEPGTAPALTLSQQLQPPDCSSRRFSFKISLSDAGRFLLSLSASKGAMGPLGV